MRRPITAALMAALMAARGPVVSPRSNHGGLMPKRAKNPRLGLGAGGPPHQGKQETERRRSQLARGVIRVNPNETMWDFAREFLRPEQPKNTSTRGARRRAQRAAR